jgi:hypothetical protein
VRVRTLLLYLIGDRQAILDLAADRRALWVGLVFVLSAGFAREYDGQYLLREPWHLLIPIGASLGAASLLFLVVCGRYCWQVAEWGAIGRAYRSFLTLFWLTAPLAWLYAIPYERFLSPAAATEANLWTLALVAAWRVLLMTRVVSVLTDRHPLTSFVLVMVFAVAVALAAVLLMPKPVVSVMGGIRHTDSEQMIAGVTTLVLVLGFLSAPVWLIGAVIGETYASPRWLVPDKAPETGAGVGVWALAAFTIVLWLPFLPVTQSEQALRWRAEEALKGGRIEEGLDLMSAHKQSDFPPQWDPPPRIGYGETKPDLFAVLDALEARERPAWVWEAYGEKLQQHIGYPYSHYFHLHSGGDLSRIVHALEKIPSGPEIAVKYEDAARQRMEDKSTPTEDSFSLQILLDLAEKAKKSKP